MPLNQAITFIKRKSQKALEKKGYSTTMVEVDAIDKDNTKSQVYVSLLFVEEEKTLKNNENQMAVYQDEKIKSYKKYNPKIHLNLYVMIASCVDSYEEALKHISAIMQDFQGKNVYNSKATRQIKADDEQNVTINEFTEIDKTNNYDKLDKLVFDMHTLSFEQNNSLWQTLGSRLRPYVVYKVRLIAISDTEFREVMAVQRIGTLTQPFPPPTSEDDAPTSTNTASKNTTILHTKEDLENFKKSQ